MEMFYQQPLDVDLVADLVEDGIRLIFDPKYQRLRVSRIQRILTFCNRA